MKYSSLKEQAQNLPHSPGVYLFKDKNNGILYIGKAKNIKKRVLSYFSIDRHNIKIKAMIKQAYHINYHLTECEDNALILEDELIKKHQPFYNTLLKDDKKFPWIKITLQDEYPRILRTRQVLNDGASYFGPFPHAHQANALINQVISLYKIRDCNKKVSSDHQVDDCLSAQINRCLAPCTHSCSLDQYEQAVDQACQFLEHKQNSVLKTMKQEMIQASEELNFEKAGQIRDSLEALKQIQQNKKQLTYTISLNTLNILKKKLNLTQKPYRIDCFDISHLSGSFPVASRSVFVKCRPQKKLYRRYQMNPALGINDVQMIYDAVKKSYTNKEPKNWPDLIVIDGGEGQLQYALKALNKMNMTSSIVSLAKRFELVFTTFQKQPIDLGKYSEERKLLQAIRNEAHRFAVTYHRKRRKKATLTSSFEKIPSIGKKTTQKLLKKFNSFNDVLQLNSDEIKKISFLNQRQIHCLLQYKENHKQ